MNIGQDSVVSLEYTIEVVNGETPAELNKVFKSEFLYGRDPIIPALGSALLGLEPGDEVEVEVPPEQAFGHHDPALIREIPLSRIAKPEELKPGAYYEETQRDGRKAGFMVKDVKEDSVIADFNHPAAGKSLKIKAKVNDVRAATVTDMLRSQSLFRSAGGG